MVHGAIDPINRLLNNIVVTETLIAVPAGSIAIYAGTTVGLYRGVEMVSGWGFLWNGIRDRALLDQPAPGGFSGATVYSVTDIDKKGENDRRTAVAFATLTANDIGIGIELEVTNAIFGAVTPLNSAFEMLINRAMEWLKVNG
jgi:hypothetical protein